MNENDLNQKFQAFERQIMQIQEQLQAVEQAIMDMSQINLGIDDLVGKKDEEIMAPIGRGIYVKAKLLEEDLTVDVGGRNFVKKTIPDTKELIQGQVKNLERLRNELNQDLEKINQEITNTMMEHQAAAEKQ